MTSSTQMYEDEKQMFDVCMYSVRHFIVLEVISLGAEGARFQILLLVRWLILFYPLLTAPPLPSALAGTSRSGFTAGHLPFSLPIGLCLS